MAPGLLSKLPRRHKNRIRKVLARWKRALVNTFLAYGRGELLEAIRRLGAAEGDSILLHAGLDPACGFQGTSSDVADTFLDAVGPPGNLLMVSLPYRSSSLAYLDRLDRFDVRRTPSAMGMVSEFFRRRDNVLRSLHPLHPVLACGPDAGWFVSGHELCLHSCGPGSPFEKLALKHGKVFFFDVPFATFTFFHFIEHRVQDLFPFPLYDERVFDVPVIDRDGRELTVRTRAFSQEIIRRRRFDILEEELSRRGIIRRRRLGNTRLAAVDLDDVLECVDDMMRSRLFFYALD